MVLGILFFLPVTFLLFLYPATHNYTPLEIINTNVLDIGDFQSLDSPEVILKDHITILGFVGNNPKSQATAVSNLKELIYDKFKGFKGFQIVMIASYDVEEEVEKLLSEISSYEDLKFWHFVFGTDTEIKQLYNSIKTKHKLSSNLNSDLVYVIDKDLNQRGRLDDRTDNEIAKEVDIYGLYGYNCIEVAEIKNKMSDDLRILFTEYRQKRKGEFNSDTRRADDLKQKTD